jgi:predicted phosphodiesterase
MIVHVLGDIHGAGGILKQVLQRYRDNRVIQVGDFGLGFHGIPDPPTDSFPDRFSFIRGNHDNPEVCRTYPNYLGDYGVMPETGIFFLGGAWSTDRAWRTEGLDWWPDEELSHEDLYKAIDLYESVKPRYVISHEAPALAAGYLPKRGMEYKPSRTSQALEIMRGIHAPEWWVFGHWHMTWRKEIAGTKFVCAAINQVVSMKVEPQVKLQSEPLEGV